MVVNDTRVLPARLRLRRPGGGEAEVLLLEPLGGGDGRRSRARRGGCGPGCGSARSSSSEHLGEGRWRLRLEGEPAGEAPLPPYITEPLADPERYQTVYAEHEPARPPRRPPGCTSRRSCSRGSTSSGSRCTSGSTRSGRCTAATLDEHALHSERYEIEPDAWERIAAAPRVLAVGTTTTRVLESLARGAPLAGRTDLFVTPGFEFRRVDALVTNFHLPRSTLLALVMAFAGIEETRRIYATAIEERYRFYSFGDAMLVL